MIMIYLKEIYHVSCEKFFKENKEKIKKIKFLKNELKKEGQKERKLKKDKDKQANKIHQNK
mgnify:FL=1